MSNSTKHRSAIYVGANRETVKDYKDAILAILSANVDNETKRVALNVLKEGCVVTNTTIKDCHFLMEE